MDTKKYMIWVKGEIKTSVIRSCQYNPYSYEWDIEFYNRDQLYSYNYYNVKKLKDPIVRNPAMYQVSHNGKMLFNIQEIYEFASGYNSYWHICFDNGSERDYPQNELTIVESCMSNKEAKNVFQYLKEIAGINDLKNKDTDEKLLRKRYDKIGFIGENVALARYLYPSLKDTSARKEVIPIFPFGCNSSQYKAVKNALENQISVIQGPPGTGKTQTILNIIANILIRGMNVLVVSNNNSAIDNVYEKLALPKYNLDFVVAKLGKDENKKKFVQEQNIEYPDFANWKISENNTITLENIKQKSEQLNDVFEKRETLSKLKNELSNLSIEVRYFEEYLNNSSINIGAIKIRKKLTSSHFIQLWQEIQYILDKKKKIGLIFKLKGIFIYGISNWDFYKQDFTRIIASFQGLFYKYKQNELIKQIEEIESYLKNSEGHLLEKMCDESLSFVRNDLALKYEKKDQRKIFVEDDLWKHPNDVLDEYPVILSSTFSSRSSLSGEVVYDYVIMDEASQVDIATGALAMSCGRNMVIVGDSKQLPNVVPSDIEKKASAVFNQYHVQEGYQYTKSFLQSVSEILPEVKQTLLREHHRCHPKIINFCNQKFYRDELIIMTEDHGEDDVLSVIKTVKGNHDRKHYNQRQIDVIKEEVLPKYNESLTEVGIIAPYNHQVDELMKTFDNVEIHTVHKFQGREKDSIIISTVDNEISKFVDDPNLLNVAVSRAKKNLILVVSGNEQSQETNLADLIAYIEYNNFEVKYSKIYSVFDYLYKQYTVARQEFLAKRDKVSEYDSENLMYALIKEVLDSSEFEKYNVTCHYQLKLLIRDLHLLEEREQQYVRHNAHLDFLIYNRISKQPVLAIEVDGYAYHQEGTPQWKRDLLKNHILEVYQIPLLRCKTNGSGEKRAIIDKLNEIIAR